MTHPPTSPSPELLRFVRGDLPAKDRARLAEAVPDAFGQVPAGLNARDRQALTYERLRAAGRAAPPAAELLDDPALLCGLLERAAVADPALFHVMLLHYTLALGPILRFGGGQQGAARARLEAFEDVGTLLMTEAGRSNSHLAPRTTAVFDAAARAFVLSTPDARAAKFPTNTAHPGVAKTAAVYATLVEGGRERGVFVFVVPVRAADGSVPDGVRIVAAPETGGLPVDYAAVRLEGVRVPYEAWLRDGASFDDEGAFHDPVGDPAARLTRSMAIGPAVWRAVVAASAAVTRASASLLAAHTSGRVTLGRLAPSAPLAGYRNQGEAVLGSLASAYTLTAVAAHVKARRTSAEAPGPAAVAAAGGAWAPWSAVDRDLALLKAAVTAAAQETVTRCRLHSGAPGFAATDRLNAYRGLTHAYMSAGGDNDLILFDTARAMAARDRYVPPPDVPPSLEDLADPQVWPALAGAVEARLAAKLAARVEGAQAGGASAFAAWNAELAPARAAATALADRTVLEIVAAAAADGPAQAAPLWRMAALDWMARRAGVLLNEGVAGPGLLDRVWAARRDLAGEVAVEPLAAALEPPSGLGAPAAFVTGE
ncbi:hypothetical protein [Actinomadura flavalba]|uniref:acyl-CoA dehydrogenase family protein n=1 Tax=Actinomadura flavalba TaxID=1120938 RepID=UPI00036A0B7D|nr:hypothetical protein [Actinomadura flavalba]